jgi:hypothetical protein
VSTALNTPCAICPHRPGLRRVFTRRPEQC